LFPKKPLTSRQVPFPSLSKFRKEPLSWEQPKREREERLGEEEMRCFKQPSPTLLQNPRSSSLSLPPLDKAIKLTSVTLEQEWRLREAREGQEEASWTTRASSTNKRDWRLREERLWQ